MKLVDINDENIKKTLKITDLENMLDVYVDKKLNLVFNLNMTLYVNVDPNVLPTFQCDHEMHWPLISYKIYSTTRLAWLLQKLNNVSMKDIFKPKQPGEYVKYLPQSAVQQIISDITDFNT